MCGRFTLTSSQEQISTVLGDLIFNDPVVARYNIAPTQDVPAVLNHDPTRLVHVYWGLVPFWAKDRSIGQRLINARAETLAKKPAFKKSLESRRCLVPADGFFEWKRTPGARYKTPVYFQADQGQPFAFAGLWATWRDPKTGDVLTSCTIITTAPNELVASVHNRMPVILRRSLHDTWLSRDVLTDDELGACATPYPAARMRCYEVSRRVNDTRHDDPACIAPADPPQGTLPFH